MRNWAMRTVEIDGSYGNYGSGWEEWAATLLLGILRDYSFVKLKLQPSQTELLSRSVDNSFLAMGAWRVTMNEDSPLLMSPHYRKKNGEMVI